MNTVDPEPTRSFAHWWMQIPQFDDNAELERWSQEFAPEIAADQGYDDPEVIAYIGALLRVAAEAPYVENFPYRLLCMPDVRRGQIVVDIGAVVVEPDEESLVATHRRLLGADDFGGNRGTQVDPIFGQSDNEVIGLQVIRFNVAEPPTPQDRTSVADPVLEQPLEAYLSCVIRRGDGPNGPVDLLAIAVTTEIELLMEAAAPLHLVLLSNAVFESP